jgi:hypothetical protein
MHACCREQLKRNIHTASQPLTQGTVSQHAVLFHALRNQWQLLTSCSSCGVGALHMRMCLHRHHLLLRGVGACVHVFVDIWCNDISLFLRAEHTSLPRPLPQQPLPAPRPQAPPHPQLALRVRFTPTIFRFAAAFVPLQIFRGGTSLWSLHMLHRGQHCQADVRMDWLQADLQPNCSERSGAKCSIPHELHTDMD